MEKLAEKLNAITAAIILSYDTTANIFAARFSKRHHVERKLCSRNLIWINIG